MDQALAQDRNQKALKEDFAEASKEEMEAV